MTIETFERRHLDAAAGLLAAQHRTHHRDGRLPRESETPEGAATIIEHAMNREHARGVVALEGGAPVAYLLGAGVRDDDWGDWAWMRLGDWAAADPTRDGPLCDLYAHLAARWVEEGFLTHIAEVPAGSPELVDTWSRLGFGFQQDYGLLDLGSVSGGTAPSGCRIRTATLSDKEALEELSPLIANHQAGSPTFSVPSETYLAEIREGYGGLVDDADASTLLAEKDGRIVGLFLWYAEPPNPVNPIIPENCAYLAVAATHPSVRGSGVGRALSAEGFGQMAEQGYQHCLTDWRTTNLTSSKFWPARGFVVVKHRMCREIREPRKRQRERT